MAEDYHLDQSDGKRYSVDPGDSAFNSISSPYSPKSSYGFRSSQQFSNGSASMSMCRQSSTSPNTFPESNRTGEMSSQNTFISQRCKSKTCLFPLSFQEVIMHLQSPRSPRLPPIKTHPPGPWKMLSGSSGMQTPRLLAPMQTSLENT